MPDQLLRSAYIASEGPLVLDGETLIGIIVKDTYVFSTAHENASEVTAYEVEPVSTESRLTGTCAVVLNDAETAWLPLVTGTTAVDLSDVEDRGGIVWVRPGASDAVRKIIGWAADIGPADAAYLPTWPDGLYAELIAPFDAMSADSTVAGVPFVDGDVDAETLADALASFLSGGGGTTVRLIDKHASPPGVVNIDLSTGADAVADDVAVVAIAGPSGGDCEFVVTPPARSNGLALGIYAYCPGHFATITIPASGPLDEVSYGPVVVPVVELVNGALAQTPASGGGGAVDSVNGQTGVVVLDADDIGDGTTNKAYTAAEQSKLAAITGTNTGDQTLPTLSSLGAVPTSRTLAGLDLSADRTASALRTALGLVIGTDVQAYDADLGTIAGLTATTDNFMQAKAGAWASRTVAQVKTDLGVGAAAFYVTIPIGDYVGMTSPTVAAQGISNYVLGAAGRGNISPIWLPTATYDRIGVYVSSGGTATLRLGLYSANATTGLPDTKVLDAGTISTASTGLIEATISESLGGWYWAAVVTDAYTSTFDLMGYGDSSAAPIFGMASRTDAVFRQRVAQASSSWTTGGLTTSPPSLVWAAAAVKVVLRRSA